ncbi:MAG: ThuA domain-containing protein [Pirellulales bacterium]|nr:ThuA domain-containing protein [Pirellulales bacterium]
MSARFFFVAVVVGLAFPAWSDPSYCFAKDAAPPSRTLAEVKTVLDRAPPGPAERKLHVVLMAGRKDHGTGEHDYPLWQKRWKVLLGGLGPGDEPILNTYGPPKQANKADLAGAKNVTVDTALDWPSPEQWEKADLVVQYSAPGWTPEKISQLDAFLKRGGGYAIIHFAVWHPDPKCVSLIGIAQQKASQYRHGPVPLDLPNPKHPICLGLPERIELVDESYFNFRNDLAKATILATCRETRRGEKDPRDEPLLWTWTPGKGRVFVCIPGHYMWTFDDPMFRILLLRGMAWAAGESPYRFDPLVWRGARVNR